MLTPAFSTLAGQHQMVWDGTLPLHSGFGVDQSGPVNESHVHHFEVTGVHCASELTDNTDNNPHANPECGEGIVVELQNHFLGVRAAP